MRRIRLCDAIAKKSALAPPKKYHIQQTTKDFRWPFSTWIYYNQISDNSKSQATDGIKRIFPYALVDSYLGVFIGQFHDYRGVFGFHLRCRI